MPCSWCFSVDPSVVVAPAFIMLMYVRRDIRLPSQRWFNVGSASPTAIAGSMLDHHLRLWPNIKPTIAQCLFWLGICGSANIEATLYTEYRSLGGTLRTTCWTWTMSLCVQRWMRRHRCRKRNTRKKERDWESDREAGILHAPRRS